MLRAELKTFDSADVPDLERFHPDYPDNFGFELTLTIGVAGTEGGNLFFSHVCTPKWMIENHQPEEIIIGGNYIIVFQYDYRALINRLKFYIGMCTGETWEDLVFQLTKLGTWEYEGYPKPGKSS